ncbi:MAG TPA: F0F1 ATP synthase subunit B [Casimicrobiaceae bacterium]|nr:F0F1 ATP synthase subunit B [Casimicrobiaceae bacterium]
MNINLTIFVQALIFAIFIWFCARYIWPPLMRAIETRQKQIAEGLAAGEEARQSLARAEQRIGEMMTEAKTRASDIVAQGEKLKSETIDQARNDAKAEAERILAAGRAEIQQEVSRAKEALRNQVADLAVAGASQILKREVDAKAHAELLSALQKQL